MAKIGSRVKVKKQRNKNSTKVTTGSKAEKAHHRAVMKAAIKVDYESGLLTRGQIVEKYGIWRSTLQKYVTEGDWEYASKRVDALTDVHTRMIKKYADHRATISDQHLDELNRLKESVLLSEDKAEVELLSAKAKTVMDIIRSERIALAMPNEYKYIEQRNENVFRVEDALKELDSQMNPQIENVIEGEFTTEENDSKRQDIEKEIRKAEESRA